MIFDKKTNDFVSKISKGRRAWLGAHRVGPFIHPMPRNDQWTWIDGTAMEFSDWSSEIPEPDNHDGGEFCLEMWQVNSKQWNDINCDSLIHDYFICQVKNV